MLVTVGHMLNHPMEYVVFDQGLRSRPGSWADCSEEAGLIMDIYTEDYFSCCDPMSVADMEDFLSCCDEFEGDKCDDASTEEDFHPSDEEVWRRLSFLFSAVLMKARQVVS